MLAEWDGVIDVMVKATDLGMADMLDEEGPYVHLKPLVQKTTTNVSGLNVMRTSAASFLLSSLTVKG